ncbi:MULTISPECIES: ATP-binding protein [Lysobacter]|jgi:transitional endoplasmic reticulum ATPase|uniref:AAA family ATPase n=2 Tax=Lysobacter gummosus TaxID=262324 RepID=A0ABY3X5W3_9GAMM|nr:MULTISPECIES: AAA family ATPase [Lysobacter]ALN92376.1 ATPase associated with various cellular activities family protein [Lysobacter gummosus]UJB20715.1 AAA family ATPase [Lysobacter capsici]UJQ30171.1 AAA family ATPase [Lysobacter gummosus]UNP27959.1 AAA family ATPase [Lysobacter gummosus]
MPDTSLDDLLAALAASPHNPALGMLVVNACLAEADPDALSRALDLSGDVLLSDATQRDAALRLLLQHRRDELVLRVAPENSAAGLFARARTLLAQGERDQARGLYQQAIALNPALEDSALATELAGKVISFANAKRIQSGQLQASLANDDTDADDVSRLLQPPQARIGFDDVGGLDEVKHQIRRRIITPFLKPSLFERFKRRSGGGILLYGPPGCGKTLLARATAGECGARFYNVAITDVLDMYIGESERKLHAIFETARRTAPAVVFFDEVEAIGGKRQYSREATSAKLVSQFLTELDGFAQNNQGVLILGATNVPWAVDAAFRRPGRFDRVLFVPPPDDSARRSILDLLLRERPLADGIETAELARLTSGYSGADLRNLVETAIDEAIEDSIEQGRESPLTMNHLRSALKDTRSTTLEWLTTARNHARYANQGGQYDEVLEFLKRHGGG